MRVACVGAGPAGLYFSILMKLRDPSTHVTIFEQNPVGVTHGWGVTILNSTIDSLWQNDPVTARSIVDQSFNWVDQVLDVKGSQPIRSSGSGFSIHRHRLLDILTERAMKLGVEIRYEHKITDATQLPDADVIVAADGAGSRLRQLSEHRFKTDIAKGRNKYVWLGTTKVFKNFTYGFVPTEAGWIWFYAYGFNEGMSTLIAECSSETWLGLGFNQYDSDKSLARLESIFEQHLSGHRLISKNHGDKSLPWLNFRWVKNKNWYVDNIVLLGDAAHTTHFSIGLGTQLAIYDAISLADHLQAQHSIRTALAAYATERQRALVRPYNDARLSARWFENIHRYVSFDPSQFSSFLLGRRSAWIALIPPAIYCQLDAITKGFPAFRKLLRLGSFLLRYGTTRA
jgi:2-polyprenyl-6-methoxyphenol hydroxylase-like FAD-dependent oxidoreductase